MSLINENHTVHDRFALSLCICGVLRKARRPLTDTSVRITSDENGVSDLLNVIGISGARRDVKGARYRGDVVNQDFCGTA
jgi:hypothetical protein